MSRQLSGRGGAAEEGRGIRRRGEGCTASVMRTNRALCAANEEDPPAVPSCRVLTPRATSPQKPRMWPAFSRSGARGPKNSIINLLNEHFKTLISSPVVMLGISGQSKLFATIDYHDTVSLSTAPKTVPYIRSLYWSPQQLYKRTTRTTLLIWT